MKFQALDLIASFGPNSIGSDVGRLIGRDGQARLGRRMWEAGRRALDVLEGVDRLVLAELSRNPAEESTAGVSSDLFDRLSDQFDVFLELGRDYLDEVFFPDFQEAIAESRIELKSAGDVSAMHVSTLSEVWEKYDFAEKVELHGRFMWGVLPALKESPELLDLTRRLSALALLIRLDDALIADVLDGRGLDDVVADVESLRLRLDVPSNEFSMIDAVVAWSRKNVAKAGAVARHSENHAMKHDVFTWLDANFSNFQSMDAAATEIAGKVVPVKWRTARDWVAEWKKVRSAGRP